MKVYFKIAAIVLCAGGLAIPARMHGADPGHCLDVLQYGTDSDIAGAFGGLAKGMGVEVDGKVLEVLAEEHSDKARAALIRYVGVAGVAEAEPILVRELEGRAKTDDYREALISSIGMLKRPSSTGPLLEAYERKETSNRVKKSILDALGAIGDRGVERRLVEIARDGGEDAELRAHAVLALGELESEGSLALFEELAQKPYEAKIVRMYCVAGMGKVGGVKALDTLGALVGDPVHEVAEYAVNAIAGVGTPRGGELLVKALRSDYDKVRYLAVQGIARMKYRDAKESLAFRADFDANTAVRLEARKALESLNAGDAVGQ